MNRAIEELGDELAKGNFRITLNISSQDLASPAFFAQFMVLAKIAPSVVGLELTERSTADHGVAISAIDQLSQAGHAVYIDDLGTGYSSLAYLHQLAVSAIKIDRAFTKTIGTESVTASVVPQILEMAAKLNLKVVVEGIETEEQAEYFRKAGSGILGQGWLFGRPAPAAMFRARFAESNKSAPELQPTA
jgi:sensor c-di-GMP phosphodiesterase-like protein